MPKFKKAKSLLANLLIFSAFFLLMLLYLPILMIYFPNHTAQAEVLNEPFYIYIPKIGASSKVIENVDPNNKEVYREALKQGVAHAKGSSLPGQLGTVFLFAHSQDSAFNLSRYNTIFFRLGELKKGDLVEIRYNEKLYRYQVEETKEVWPNEVDYLTKSQGDKLILQTCTPIGTSLKRLLVFTKPL